MDAKQEIPVKTSRTIFDLIDMIAQKGGSTPAELESELDMATSTLNDHLRSLERLGFLIQRGGEYKISSRFLEIGTQQRHKMPIFKKSKDETKELAEQTGEYASLMIEENGRGVFLYSTSGKNADKISIRQTYPGARSELHATAPGKAILSSLSENRFDEIIDQYGLKKKTENTITEREELEAEIAKIQEQGYAVSNEEIVKGVRSVAVPIVHRANDIHGAIAVYGLANRINEEIMDDDLTTKLKDAANKIEINLNYSG